VSEHAVHGSGVCQEPDADAPQIPGPLVFHKIETGQDPFFLVRHGQIIVCITLNGNRKVICRPGFFIEKKPALVYNNAMAYKVVETSTVTDEEIERILNEWTAQGYVFESIQFVNAISSKRPTMAFVFFTKKE
jgi:hypothetical protein